MKSNLLLEPILVGFSLKALAAGILLIFCIYGVKFGSLKGPHHEEIVWEMAIWRKNCRSDGFWENETEST